MCSRDSQKHVKIFYLDENQLWQPYAKASLHLDIQNSTYALKIALHNQLETHLLPILPVSPLLQPQKNTIQIELQRITKVERLEDLLISVMIQEWDRVLAFSFRDQEYCDIISEQLELNTPITANLSCPEDKLIEYVAERVNRRLQQINDNPFFVEIFFNSEDVIAAFVRQAQIYEKQEDTNHKRTIFRALKLLLLRADRQSLKILLKEDYYQYVLMGFSFNYEFGDRMIHYHQQYKRLTNCSNVLGITDAQILQKYKEIIRIRFLINVATSMFIQPPTQAVLMEILNQNTYALIEYLSKNAGCLSRSNELAKNDPQAFIQLFSQLWEMFKSIMEDVSSVIIKRNFRDIFISQDIINTSFQTVQLLAQTGRGTGRLYQQYLEALNPFLSYRWNQSQQLFLFLYEQNKTHILQILLSVLKVADYNTKIIVLLFAKNLVESTENRPKMKQSFLNYFFNQFVSKCVCYFVSTEQLQILVDFYMKLYRIDLIRTRRSIIQSQLLQKIGNSVQNKYILMLALKILKFFLQFKNSGIFQYIQHHSLFSQLRLKYHEVKKYNPKGIIHSLFVGLLKDVHKTNNKTGVLYIHNLMFPQSKVQ